MRPLLDPGTPAPGRGALPADSADTAHRPTAPRSGARPRGGTGRFVRACGRLGA